MSWSSGDRPQTMMAFGDPESDRLAAVAEGEARMINGLTERGLTYEEAADKLGFEAQ